MSPLRSRSRGAILAVFIFVLISPVFAAPGAVQDPAKSSGFSYSSQDLRDPFESVYVAKALKTLPNSKAKEGYELEELKLVGIIKTGAVKFAMMEDVQGRGLMFKKGYFLNSSLWLLDILEDKVILAHKLRGDIRKIAMDIPRKQER